MFIYCNNFRIHRLTYYIYIYVHLLSIVNLLIGYLALSFNHVKLGNIAGNTELMKFTFVGVFLHGK